MRHLRLDTGSAKYTHKPGERIRLSGASREGSRRMSVARP
jgi:hypothetical protein